MIDSRSQEDPQRKKEHDKDPGDNKGRKRSIELPQFLRDLHIAGLLEQSPSKLIKEGRKQPGHASDYPENEGHAQAATHPHD